MASKRKAEQEKQDIEETPKRPRTAEFTPPLPPRASLLGLPQELRDQIYAYILSNNLIHITTRPCKPYDKGAFRSNVRSSSWTPVSRSWKKWTHTICQVPGDWEENYRMSKNPGLDDEVTSAPKDYFARHDKCSWIQDDFQDRAFNFQCEHSVQMGYRHHGCVEQLRHAEEMERKFGRAEEGGLKRLHEGSKLHLEILVVCRQVYEEARLLPYSTNIFNFDYPSALQDFVSQALPNPRQVQAITSLQTGSWLPEDILTARQILPGLRYLQYAGEQAGELVKGMDLDYTFPQRRSVIIDRVEIMISVRSGQVEDRDVRRRIAEVGEMALMGRS